MVTQVLEYEIWRSHTGNLAGHLSQPQLPDSGHSLDLDRLAALVLEAPENPLIMQTTCHSYPPTGHRSPYLVPNAYIV